MARGLVTGGRRSSGSGGGGVSGGSGGASRSGLTPKEKKIIAKRSMFFDSNTKGAGLPKKSSKETITGRKPAKPKSTVNKDINKNTISKGKAKVIRRVEDINETADYRTGGAFAFKYKKGKLKEVAEDAGTFKIKPRNLGKALKKMAPNSKESAKRYAKRDKSTGPFGVKPVPVKKKGK